MRSGPRYPKEAEVLDMKAQRVITAGSWLFACLLVLVVSLFVLPRGVAPLIAGLPQGSAELLSYYAAW